ncbi:cellular tumor antigen p53 isoform X2 [Cryptotermes secundus]|uniref:cellular tumor antigen p53 isoform X2 n=1 Tax=Cryptotermes secundus TaxID=105785 RepID=UPI000CD7B7D1|nr:cellular tumor antigen p53 isoform X2 [Cryptotermes secundus]
MLPSSAGGDMTEGASSNDESAVLTEFGNLMTASEYEELLEACGTFEGIHDGIKEEVYIVDDVTAVQEPQTSVQSAQFHNLGVDRTQQATIQYSQFNGPSSMSASLLPSPTCAMPAREEYPGPHNFEIQIDGRSSSSKWMFSHVMNKLFITLKTVIHLGFKCDNFGAGLFVRALLVHCDAEAFQEPVVRCLHHKFTDHPDNAGIDVKLIDYVLHIDHSQAIYEFDEKSGRFSVRMALSHPQAGTDWVTMAFKFMCKNSCLSGLNRRPTEVIFTLENERGAVLGRRKMKVRICSSPKRDITKAENDSEAKQEQKASEGKVAIHPPPEQLNQRAKKKKFDEFFQQAFLGEAEFLDVTLCAHARIKRTLQVENRQPTEKEAALLKKYERDLECGFSPGN